MYWPQYQCDTGKGIRWYNDVINITRHDFTVLNKFNPKSKKIISYPTSQFCAHPKYRLFPVNPK